MIRRRFLDYTPILFFAIFALFLLDRRAPVDVQLVEHDKFVEAGGTLHVDYVTHRMRSCRVEIIRSMIDADGVEYWQKVFDRVVEASPKAASPSIDYKVPARAAKGPAVWTTKGRYACNWAQKLWPIEVHYWDLHFLVK